MYDVFDRFLNVGTWHTCHSLDERRFMQALHHVVRDPDFSADEMASYIRQKLGDSAQNYEDAIKHYTSAAWGVRDYLEANSLL